MVVKIMKEKLIGAAAAVLNVIYCVFKLLPVKKKITYISRQSNTLSVDYRLVIGEMKKRCPEYRNITLIKMIGDGIPAKIGYCFHMLRQMYHIATSEMVVLDTYCIAVSLLKQRDSLIVIQMWHALGALKKFGYSILDKEEGTERSLAEAMKMHRNYSYVFSSSEYCSRFFAEAFHVSMDKMIVMPLPRLDLLNNRKYGNEIKERIFRKYPMLSDPGKKIIVYAPTFRKEDGGFEEEELRRAAEKLADAVDYNRYHFIAKFHPLSNITLENPKVIQDTSFSTIDFCRIADAVVLDYSAVVFEVAVLEKTMYFYTFDYDSYMKNRDVYIDFKEIVPGMITGDAEEITAAIDRNETDTDRLERFRELMVRRPEGKNYTEDIGDFFEKILNGKQTVSNERKKQ